MELIMPIVKARIEGGVVVEAYLIWERAAHPHLESWADAPTEVGVGWRYDGATFTPPAE